MDVLLINSNDSSGGAARAAYQLHQGFHEIGLNSQMLVQIKGTDNSTVTLQQAKLNRKIAQFIPTLTTWPLPLYRQRENLLFSPQWFPDRLVAQVKQINPSIINLHWICQGFVKIETLPKFKKPLVWTCHDMWPFTGGCHYSGKCNRYQESCGNCPILHSNQKRDLSNWVWQRKAKAWKNLNLTIVTPSSWLAKCVSSSSLFKDLAVKVIPNGLDLERFKPIDQKIARQILNLPEDKQLVLFGSLSPTSDRRKGFHLLQPALQSLSQAGWQDKIQLVIFGSSQPKEIPELGFECSYLGRFDDDISLALVYVAADVFVAPSIQDNLPNTIMEAIACGTPCVGFNIGGIPDLIDPQLNGYLAQPFEIEDLAKGIAWVLEDPERHKKLSHQAREKAQREFSQELQAQRYSSLFEEILQK
ncbi:MAG: glycosyltransferase family 4 protein [Microcoleaceae cyanobacterium MO_207.B10]|nr:glycosyltransferase family 4 protein [Microcoleaceae cyanobacterium MO_207.B10]